MHTPTVCALRADMCALLEPNMLFFNVSFLKRRTQVSIPCSIQFSSAGTAPPRQYPY